MLSEKNFNFCPFEIILGPAKMPQDCLSQEIISADLIPEIITANSIKGPLHKPKNHKNNFFG